MIGVPCSAPPPPRAPPPGSQMLPPTAAAAASTSAAASPAASAPKICFNYNCKEPKSEVPCKKGWRLRSGEHADLCNRCSCTYEQGMFCETFHVNVGGWRNCESCGKRIHCGCIVSAPSYMLLDAGGIECVSCAKKAVLMAPKQQMWPSPSLHPVQVSERPKEFSAKARNQTGPFLGQWRQASNLWNVASAQSELHQRLAYEFDRPSIAEKLFAAGRPLISPQEKKVEDLSVRTVSSGPKNAIRERFAKGTSCLDSLSAFNSCSGEEGKTDCMQDSGHLSGENDRVFTAKGLISDPCSTGSRVNFETHPNSCVNLRQSSFPKEDSTSPVVGLTAPFAAPNDPNDSARASTSQPNKQTAPSSVNQIHLSSENIIDLSGEPQVHMQNGRSRGDTRPQAQLLPRNWPRTTDEEIHRISREPKYEITPLFEKTLSASDAGRIGRLVLPKKCAEAYFPRITHPEGLPLKVQDATGNEWVLQFRFWPNNNSRMYVLEGVTSCIQSMQLQAGDTVTFSRKDPEGKLVMGCKKASDMPPVQDNQSLKSVNVVEAPPNVNGIITAADYVPNLPPLPLKSSTESRNPNTTEDRATCSKLDKSDLSLKNEPASTSLEIPSKKKGTPGNSKRLRIDQEDSIQLKLTWLVAQELLRPPHKMPSIVHIEGHEFEEYQEAPTIGMPTFSATNQEGEKCQWIQCDDCSKWRKLPVDVLLLAKWTCSDNTWDPKRSSCSAAQELSMEELAGFLPMKIVAGPSKRSKVKKENDTVGVSDRLDNLANLAILGDSEEVPPSFQTTSKHPRHRLGCQCIVCIQPPSGKPKHSQTCTCNVCVTVKRRFRTLTLRREKRQSEKEADDGRMHNQSIELSPISKSNDDHESERGKPLPSPLKAQIDLNIQPERDEEPSPIATAASRARPFSNATS